MAIGSELYAPPQFDFNENGAPQEIRQWLNRYRGVVQNSLQHSRNQTHITFVGFTQEQVRSGGLPEGVLRDCIEDSDRSKEKIGRTINNSNPHQIVVVAAGLRDNIQEALDGALRQRLKMLEEEWKRIRQGLSPTNFEQPGTLQMIGGVVPGETETLPQQIQCAIDRGICHDIMQKVQALFYSDPKTI